MIVSYFADLLARKNYEEFSDFLPVESSSNKPLSTRNWICHDYVQSAMKLADHLSVETGTLLLTSEKLCTNPGTITKGSQIDDNAIDLH